MEGTSPSLRSHEELAAQLNGGPRCPGTPKLAPHVPQPPGRTGYQGLCVPAPNQEARASCLRKLLLPRHGTGSGTGPAGSQAWKSFSHSGTGFVLSFLQRPSLGPGLGGGVLGPEFKEALALRSLP